MCLGGEADAGVRLLSATIDTAAFIVNPWNGCPQLAAKVAFATEHVPIFATLPVPSQLEIVAERIKLLMDKATDEIRRTKDLDIQGRLDSMYEEVKRMVEELAAPNMIRDQMEKIYGETPPEQIRWTTTPTRFHSTWRRANSFLFLE